MSLTGYDYNEKGYNSVIDNGLDADDRHVKAIVPPIGSVIAWYKHYNKKEDSTTTGTTTNKLVDSGATFVSDGVLVGSIVINVTDGTESYVTAIDSETQLTVADDVFPTGKAYELYDTPWLPDGYVECNGQTLSDADSPYNGLTIPDLNGSKVHLRGDDASGTLGVTNYTAPATHSHSVNITTSSTCPASSNGVNACHTHLVSGTTGNATEDVDVPTFTILWIMRIK